MTEGNKNGPEKRGKEKRTESVEGVSPHRELHMNFSTGAAFSGYVPEPASLSSPFSTHAPSLSAKASCYDRTRAPNPTPVMSTSAFPLPVFPRSKGPT
ncbi:hypothetical protein E5288_WYG005647 [Bos mutus]|uniref:Uncharacterized protein n=1 Tax=Bos mutus TaxID=72004 RepID=A0A6B0RLJ0_9CETA|nr:hypothetical protein [Bos mutus]